MLSATTKGALNEKYFWIRPNCRA